MEQLEWKLRKDICEVAHRLYVAGFMTGSDGNLSSILNDNEILITPSRVCKGFMEPHQIVKVDRQGRQISGDLPATSETNMHIAAYEERPDICSVIHSHPPLIVAFTVAGLNLPSRVLPEIEVIFGGEIPIAPYATPGGVDVANSIRPFIRERSNRVVVLDHHGLIAVGQDIFQASNYVEHTEAAAKIIFYARLLGGEKALPPDSLDKLKEVRKKIVEMESKVFSGYCHAPECEVRNTENRSTDTPVTSMSDQQLENLIRQIVQDYRAGRK